jgi:hypothetical protein
MKAIASVDGKQVGLTELVFPDMSLSSSRDPAQQAAYSISIGREHFIALLREPYVGIVTELRRDDAIVGTATDSLGKAGYPTLEELLGNPTLLFDAVEAHLKYDLLSQLLPDSTGPYLIDTVTSVTASPTAVTVCGICERRQRGA